jgi:hypothetical protein
MQFIERPARLGYRGGVGSRANSFLAKTLAVVTGGVVLASAFLLSLVFFAIAAAVILVGGGYFWWKTRELRKQLRAQMSAAQAQHSHDEAFTRNVIEGVVISRGESHDDSRRPR